MLRKFLDSSVGNWVVIIGIIILMTFGTSLAILEMALFLHLSEPYLQILTIGSIVWVPLGIIILIVKGDDYIFKKIYPDWDNEDMVEAFRNQV